MLTSKATPWKWKSVEQKAFKWAKKIVSQEILLAYPNFNILFKAHTDTSDTHFGVVISQLRMTLVFYLCKLNTAQKNCAVMEQELLDPNPNRSIDQGLQ
eukprot:11744487-Ditylum_brightwellii.AAC.2